MSSYLSTTVTQGFLTEYEDKASHTRQHWSLGHVETVEHRAGQMEVGVVWRRGYVQFWRAFKCRCCCSVRMTRYRLQSDWLLSSKFWRRREKLCKRQCHHQIPSLKKKELATMLLMVPEPIDPSY